jgi:hypothetical protein
MAGWIAANFLRALSGERGVANNQRVPVDGASFVLNRRGFHPVVFALISPFQGIYKAVWLLAKALPRLRSADFRREIHRGIASSLALTVILYPSGIP